MKHAQSKGFTLLELLVTATLIAILTVIGIVSYAQVNKRSRDVKRKSDLEQIRSALEMYRSDNGGAYPSAGSGGVTDAQNLAASLVPTYLPSIPADPNSTERYDYQAVQNSNVYNVYCLSAILETMPTNTTQTTCSVSLPVGGYNYGLKNP